MPTWSRMTRSRTAIAVGSILAVVAVSCTGGSSPRPQPPTAEPDTGPLEGQLLVIRGTGGFGSFDIVGLYSVVSGDLESFEDREIEFVQTGLWGPDGNAYLMADVNPSAEDLEFATELFGGTPRQLARLFRIEPGKGMSPLGAALPFADLVGFAGDLLVAATCTGHTSVTWVLDRTDPDAWRRVADGCPAAVSPDGDRIAYAERYGHEIWTVDILGRTRPEKIADLSTLEGLAGAGLPKPRIWSLAWGDPGLAVIAGDDLIQPERHALVFLPASGGPPDVIPLGDALPAGEAWQPGGSLLAFHDCIDCFGFNSRDQQGEIRVYDAHSGELRQVAVTTEYFVGLAWSPSGDALVSRWRSGELLFVAPDGRELERRQALVLPMDWGP
jgi:hypothetical protein